MPRLKSTPTANCATNCDSIPTQLTAIYFAQSLPLFQFWSFPPAGFPRWRKRRPSSRRRALCCRIRDEARYLEEWVEYYLAAGVDHFFFSEKLSGDDYRTVLQPYMDRGLVTLFDHWPHVPVSPAAEQDCILRSVGRFEWVGFVDADEFVVLRDTRGIPEFLAEFPAQAGVALHMYMFGSNGHRFRPHGPVIAEYTRRSAPSSTVT